MKSPSEKPIDRPVKYFIFPGVIIAGVVIVVVTANVMASCLYASDDRSHYSSDNQLQVSRSLLTNMVDDVHPVSDPIELAELEIRQEKTDSRPVATFGELEVIPTKAIEQSFSYEFTTSYPASWLHTVGEQLRMEDLDGGTMYDVTIQIREAGGH